jgi:hypothetical protein
LADPNPPSFCTPLEIPGTSAALQGKSETPAPPGSPKISSKLIRENVGKMESEKGRKRGKWKVRGYTYAKVENKDKNTREKILSVYR